MSEINLCIKDRDGKVHNVIAPTDMAMNLMEIVKSYELADEGTIGICGGMAMCASCQCYINSNHNLPIMEDEEEAEEVEEETEAKEESSEPEPEAEEEQVKEKPKKK